MHDTVFYLLVLIAAFGAGFTNAVAGGGTLISFPVLLALGIPPVAANITNTVALCPGYLGATFAQMKDIKPQKSRLLYILPAAVVGGIGGALLLIFTEEKLFSSLVPFLILAASLLLAFQDRLKKKVFKTEKHSKTNSHEKKAIIPITFAAVYGGYFGAGLGVMVLSVLGLTIDDSFTKLNALKQLFSFTVNISAAIFFVFSGQVLWAVALVMAAGALFGGSLGGKISGKIKPLILRHIVVSLGILIAIVYLVKDYF